MSTVLAHTSEPWIQLVPEPHICATINCDNPVLVEGLYCRRCWEEMEALERWEIERTWRRQERRERWDRCLKTAAEIWFYCWDFARKYDWIPVLALGAWVLSLLIFGLINN